MTLQLKAVHPSMDLFSGGNFDVSTWANRQLTPHLIDALGHFLLLQNSQHTRAAYARDISEFLTFCKETCKNLNTVNDITEKHALLWKEYLTQKHSKFENSRRRVAQSSIARKLCTLSSFLDFALKRKLIEENPLTRVKRPKVRRQSHATVLNADEIRTVLADSRNHLESLQVELSNGTIKTKAPILKAQTEWCILVLLFTVGMRVSELCSLKLKDISMEGDLLRIHLLAKGGRLHNPLIHSETAKILLNYIATVREGVSPESPLFTSSRGGRQSAKVALHIHRSTVFRIVRESARRAGIKRNFSPHGCRATLATQLHLNEVPVVEIQGLLNHAQVTTTQLYLHRINDEREAASLQLPWANKLNIKPLRT